MDEASQSRNTGTPLLQGLLWAFFTFSGILATSVSVSAFALMQLTSFRVTPDNIGLAALSGVTRFGAVS